jgi:hypothetical protein
MADLHLRADAAVALGLWLGRQAVLGLVPSPSDLPLS